MTTTKKDGRIESHIRADRLVACHKADANSCEHIECRIAHARADVRHAAKLAGARITKIYVETFGLEVFATAHIRAI